eukprot:2989259-Alexandrium_andersonii.AAC.1
MVRDARIQRAEAPRGPPRPKVAREGCDLGERAEDDHVQGQPVGRDELAEGRAEGGGGRWHCLLYTSDAADDM